MCPSLGVRISGEGSYTAIILRGSQGQNFISYILSLLDFTHMWTIKQKFIDTDNSMEVTRGKGVG